MGNKIGFIVGVLALLGLLVGGVYLYTATGDDQPEYGPQMVEDGIYGKVKDGAGADVDMLDGEEVPGELPASEYENFETYTKDKEGITIKYPTDWVSTPGTGPTAVVFTSPLQGNSDSYQETVTVAVQDISATELSLDEFSDQAMKALPNYMENLQIMKQGEAELDGELAKTIHFSGTYPATDYLTETYQIYTVYDGYVYIITYTGMPDDFEHLMPTVGKMISSFHF